MNVLKRSSVVFLVGITVFLLFITLTTFLLDGSSNSQTAPVMNRRETNKRIQPQEIMHPASKRRQHVTKMLKPLSQNMIRFPMPSKSETPFLETNTLESDEDFHIPSQVESNGETPIIIIDPRYIDAKKFDDISQILLPHVSAIVNSSLEKLNL